MYTLPYDAPLSQGGSLHTRDSSKWFRTADSTGKGGFPIQYVSFCILHVSCMYPEGYMYPECILMYLKCILHALLHSKRIHVSFTLCMYFTRIPNESKRYILGYTLNTSRYMYLGRFLGGTLDTCQDTSGYVYLGLFITIHQDTPRYKITIHVSWTRHDEYMWNTCKDSCGIHAGYMYLHWFQDT